MCFSGPGPVDQLRLERPLWVRREHEQSGTPRKGSRHCSGLPGGPSPPELFHQADPCLLVSSPCGEHRTNIGLNLKFNKKNEEVPGYTKRTEKEWLYSAAVEEVLAEYLDRSRS